MRDEAKTYSILELAELSGVNPRTIHFYISRGLLEGVGRQGPSSRYPEGHLHRLIFIRELQAQARLSLDEIAKVLAGTDPTILTAVAEGREQLSVMQLREDLPAEPAPDGRLGDAMATPPQLGSARSRALRFFSRRPDRPEAPAPSRAEALGSVLSGLSGRSWAESSSAPPREGSWVSIHVTDDLTLSARGLSPEELRILEQIGHSIAEILNRARSETDEKEKQ